MIATSIAFRGNGLTVTYDDGSVASGVFKMVDGVVTIIGFTGAQLAALSEISIDPALYNDPRFVNKPGIPITSSDNTWTGKQTFDEIEYSDTYWDDLRVPIASTNRGGSKDPDFSKWLDNGAGSQGVFLYWFDKSLEEELYFVAQMPHNWKIGTDIHPHVHWIPKSNGGAGERVSWGLEYTWVDVGEVAGNTTIIYTNSLHNDDESLVANKQYISAFPELDSTGHSLSSMLNCRVFRDASGAGATDDYGDDAALKEIDFHHEQDTPGSRQPFIK